MRDIAEAIGGGLGVPARGLSPDEARAQFDWMAMFVGIDNPTSSAATRARTGASASPSSSSVKRRGMCCGQFQSKPTRRSTAARSALAR